MNVQSQHERKRKGCGRGSNQRRGSQNKKNNTTELKFYPHQMGRQQGVTYDTVKDHILQTIQKTNNLGKEVATSLRDVQEIDYNKK